MDLKQLIAAQIHIEGLSQVDIKKLITVAANKDFGDYALPCFTLAKERRTSPVVIAQEIQKNLKENNVIEKTEIVGGYLNFFLNKQTVGGLIAKELEQESFFVDKEQEKLVCVEYASPNLAKFMHIGHYNCTILGESLARMQEFFGHKVVRINYIGDYGTPFGKMVVAYKEWGNKEEVEKGGIDEIQNLYVKFNQEQENDERLMELARKASKNIEEKQGEDYEIYKWFISISTHKVKEVMDLLGVKFDDWRGESTYNNDLKNMVAELVEKGIAKESQGALIVDLTDANLGVAVVQRSDGGSLYITRDLVAAKDRFERYNFDEMIYITALQQDLHFAQLFEISKRLNRPYAGKLKHVNYGMFSTPEGKIASRKGKQAVLEDILAEAIAKAENILATRNMPEERKKQIAVEIAKGAMAFSIFKVETTKDKVFDLQSAISFDGDTSPYLQYAYARCQSLVSKSKQKAAINSNEFFANQNAFELLKQMANFKSVIKESYENQEPSYIARALLDLVKEFNSLYATTQILNGEFEAEKMLLIQGFQKTLKIGLNLLCINVIDEM